MYEFFWRARSRSLPHKQRRKRGLGVEHAGFAIRICAQSVRAVAVLGIEDHVGRLALRKDRAVLPVGSECSAGTDVGEKRVGIEQVLGCHIHPLA